MSLHRQYMFAPYVVMHTHQLSGWMSTYILMFCYETCIVCACGSSKRSIQIIRTTSTIQTIGKYVNQWTINQSIKLSMNYQSSNQWTINQAIDK